MYVSYLLGANSLYKARGSSRQVSTWSKLVALCTKSMGGYYRANGTVVRNASASQNQADDDAIYVENDVTFASLTERTHARIRHQETLRQSNLEAILSITSSLIGQKVTEKQLDSDWINLFFDYAQNISSDAMQTLWAKALLTEIKHPNAISKRSLQFLYHCDAWEITAFRKVANYAFIGLNGHPFLFKATTSLTEEDAVFNEQRLLAHCVNAGLISGQASELKVGQEFYYRKQKHAVAHDFTPHGQGLGFYMQPFTKTGSDLLKIIGGVESIPSSNMQRRLVWEYLSDFVNIDTAKSSKRSHSDTINAVAG